MWLWYPNDERPIHCMNLLALPNALHSIIHSMSRAGGQSTSAAVTAPTATSPASSSIFRTGDVARMAKTVSFVRILHNNTLVLHTSLLQPENTFVVIVEGTLNGGYSSVDISKIPPHSFDSPLAFSYTDGAGGRAVRRYLVLYYIIGVSCSFIIVQFSQLSVQPRRLVQLLSSKLIPANGIPHSLLCYERLWCSSGRLQHRCSACFTSVCFSLSYTPSIIVHTEHHGDFLLNTGVK
jgi:hypothetical protein